MTHPQDNPFDGLEKVFHEPKRLAIMSALCAAGHGMCFAELKRECDLTDGNLNRHLKTLGEAGVVSIAKDADSRPGRARRLTRIHLTPAGRDGFHAYLHNLESVLSLAVEAMDSERLAHGASLDMEGSMGQMA